MLQGLVSTPTAAKMRKRWSAICELSSGSVFWNSHQWPSFPVTSATNKAAIHVSELLSRLYIRQRPVPAAIYTPVTSPRGYIRPGSDGEAAKSLAPDFSPEIHYDLNSDPSFGFNIISRLFNYSGHVSITSELFVTGHHRL